MWEIVVNLICAIWKHDSPSPHLVGNYIPSTPPNCLRAPFTLLFIGVQDKQSPLQESQQGTKAIQSFQNYLEIGLQCFPLPLSP